MYSYTKTSLLFSIRYSKLIRMYKVTTQGKNNSWKWRKQNSKSLELLWVITSSMPSEALSKTYCYLSPGQVAHYPFNLHATWHVSHGYRKQKKKEFLFLVINAKYIFQYRRTGGILRPNKLRPKKTLPLFWLPMVRLKQYSM